MKRSLPLLLLFVALASPGASDEPPLPPGAVRVRPADDPGQAACQRVARVLRDREQKKKEQAMALDLGLELLRSEPRPDRCLRGELTEALIELLERPRYVDADVLAITGSILASTASEEHYDRLLEAARRFGRHSALTPLRGQRNESLHQPLLELTGHRSPKVVLAAVQLLTLFPGDETRTTLVPVVKDTREPPVLDAALNVLAIEAHPTSYGQVRRFNIPERFQVLVPEWYRRQPQNRRIIIRTPDMRKNPGEPVARPDIDLSDEERIERLTSEYVQKAKDNLKRLRIARDAAQESEEAEQID